MLVKIKDIIKTKYNLETKSVPLRIWTREWGLPKDFKLKKYIVNTNTSHKTNVNLNRYALFGEIESAEDFIKRTYKENNPKQWGKGKKSGRRFDYNILNNKIWIKILSKSPHISTDKRELFFDGRYLRMSLHPIEIALWHLSGEGQVRFVILPKFIDLKEEFFELIGFLDGEMCTKTNLKGGSSVKISNSEPAIIKQILNQFKKIFNIPPKFWTASITMNNKNSNFNEEDNKKIKDFWSKITNIPLSNFSKTTVQNKYKSNFSQYGIIQIRYSDTLFFSTLLQVMKNIRQIIIKNKEYCKAYLRGVVAGEGGIGKRKNKLRMIHIGGMKDEDKEFYTKCLKKIGITSIQRYKLRIEICDLKNFIILRDIDIFKYIYYRKENFLSALDNLEKSYKMRKSSP